MAEMGEVIWSGISGEYRYGGVLPVRQYPSGEPLIGFPKYSHRRIDRVLLRACNLNDLVTGLFFVDSVRERQVGEIDLILPFVPGARQDRLNSAGDFLFSAKSVAREINARGFRQVTILDPHSEVTPALIDRCRVMHASECFRPEEPFRYKAVIAPDAGSEKRAGAVAKKYGIPLIHGWKTRNVATGDITGFGLEHRPDLEHASVPNEVVVVDDICDGGGTFIGLGKVIRDRGYVADLYVTHGLFTQGTEKLFSAYRRVYCTDSIIANRPGVLLTELCQNLIEAPC